MADSHHKYDASTSRLGRLLGVFTMKFTNKILCCAMLIGAATLFSPGARAATPTDDDKKFVAAATQGDINEIKLSELAQQKASNPAVKAFADKMVKEHKMMFKSIAPFADAWGITVATDLDDDHKSEYKKLDGLSGADFDKEYIDQMVSDHAKGLDAFTDEAKDTKDAKLKAAVLKGKTMVAAHKNMAYDLKKKL
jgi:putative membrane protein